MSDSLLGPLNPGTAAGSRGEAADRRLRSGDRREGGFDFPERLEQEWALQQQAANDSKVLHTGQHALPTQSEAPGPAAAQSGALPASYLDALFAWGVHCYSQRRWSDAQPVLRHLASAAPHDARFHRAWGALLLATERPGQAAAAFEAVHGLAPHDAENLFHWGQALQLMGRTAAAVQRWNQARDMAQAYPARWPELEAWCDDWLRHVQGA